MKKFLLMCSVIAVLVGCNAKSAVPSTSIDTTNVDTVEVVDTVFTDTVS